VFNLIGLLAIKTPRHRENVRSVHEQILKQILLLATETPEQWESELRRAKEHGNLGGDDDTDYERMREFISRDQYKINLRTPYHLQLELILFDKVLPYIFARNWILVKAPLHTTGFITSDHPVCLMWSDPAKRGDFVGPGLGRRGTQIVFPISNELAMVGTFEPQTREMEANKLLIAHINGTVIVHANRQIYARDSDFVYQMVHNERIMNGAGLLNDECITGADKNRSVNEGYRDAREEGSSCTRRASNLKPLRPR
jgi:hypothetical protein